MWSTKECDTPVPLSQTRGGKDALESLRESQDHDIVKSHTPIVSVGMTEENFILSEYNQEKVNDGMMREVKDSFSTFTNDASAASEKDTTGASNGIVLRHEMPQKKATWVEFSPQHNKKATVATFQQGTPVTAGASSHDIVLNMDTPLDESEDEEDNVIIVGVEDNEESHQDQQVASSNKEQDAIVASATTTTADTVATTDTIATTATTIAKEDVAAAHKSLKKKAFRWFRRSRGKKGDEKSKDIDTTDAKIAAMAVNNEIMDANKVVDSPDKNLVEIGAVEARDLAVVDDGPIHRASVECEVAQTVVVDRAKDVGNVVGKGDTVHVESVKHANVKKDDVGIVAGDRVIAHETILQEASCDSSDEDVVKHVAKDDTITNITDFTVKQGTMDSTDNNVGDFVATKYTRATNDQANRLDSVIVDPVATSVDTASNTATVDTDLAGIVPNDSDDSNARVTLACAGKDIVSVTKMSTNTVSLADDDTVKKADAHSKDRTNFGGEDELSKIVPVTNEDDAAKATDLSLSDDAEQSTSSEETAATADETSPDKVKERDGVMATAGAVTATAGAVAACAVAYAAAIGSTVHAGHTQDPATTTKESHLLGSSCETAYEDVVEANDESSDETTRQANNRNGANDSTLDEDSMKKAEASNDWTRFDGEDAFKADSAANEAAVAEARLPFPQDDTAPPFSLEGETHKAPVNEDTQEKDEEAASVAVATAAEAMATGVTSSDASAKDDAAQKALKMKAFRWFGLRRSNSSKAVDKYAIGMEKDARSIEGRELVSPVNEEIGETAWIDTWNGDWTDFDGMNVFKADRAPDDAVVAAAAVPLPPDDPEEYCTNEESNTKVSADGDQGGSQVALDVAGAMALSAAMSGDDYLPTRDNSRRQDFDEEAQLLDDKSKATPSGCFTRCRCSLRLKLVGIVIGHLIVVGVVLGTVLPMIFNKATRDSSVPAAGTSPGPSPTILLMPTFDTTPAASPTPEPSTAPSVMTLEPTLPPVQLPLDELLSSVSFDGGAALRSSFTAQAVAFNWLRNNTFLDTYSDEKRIQRYSLATVYYSSNGDSWDNNTGWLSDVDECYWFNTAFGGFCSSDGIVVELDIMDNGMDGTIPEEIALLPLSTFFRFKSLIHSTFFLSVCFFFYVGCLEELNLAENNLVGTLPTTIGQLTRLGESPCVPT